MEYIADTPGLSGAELAKVSGVPYADAVRGLAKLKEFDVVTTASETISEDRIRYRYTTSDDPNARERFVSAMRNAETIR